jgi:hypothetical protein
MMRKPSLPLAAATLLGLLAAAGAQAATSTRLLGEPVPTEQAQRTVVIGPDTKWVNVTQGEIVRFDAQGRDFAFDFDGLPRAVNLAAIAPPGTVDHPVTVYVAGNPELN